MKKIFKCKKVGIEKKVKKQDGMSTIIVNYSDKIIRRKTNFIPTLQQIIIILACVVHILYTVN